MNIDSIAASVDALKALARAKNVDGKERIGIKEKRLIDSIFSGAAVNSGNRFPLFHSIGLKLSPAQYSYALSLAYTLSDDLYRHRKQVREAFEVPWICGRYLMNSKERKLLERLPDEVAVFRAMSVNEAKGRRYGVSWTLSKKVAEFFRDTYVRNYSTNHLERVIKEKTIPKSEIVAIFNGRKEQEVIYLGNG